MIPFNLDDRVTAAAVAAGGTIVGALIQLGVAWRKEVSDRARGVPMTRKSRRGPVLAVVLLMLASGVGGFALSQFLVAGALRESAALQDRMKTELDQFSATAARLERASLSGPAEAPAPAPTPAAGAGAESGSGAAASVTVGPCRRRGAPGADDAGACSEQDAVAVTLCASVPLAAVVSDVRYFVRPEDPAAGADELAAAPAQDAGRARFAEKTFEHPESDRSRRVCTVFSSWDSDHALTARMRVGFGLRSG